jgi:hypothetical protein
MALKRVGALCAAATLVAIACKTPGNNAKVKDDDALPQDSVAPAEPPPDQAQTEADTDQAVTSAAGGFDVNDWSIFFPTKDGLPYPNITLDGFKDNRGTEVWPKATAFQPLIAFATGGATTQVTGAVETPQFTRFDEPGADSLALVTVDPARKRRINALTPKISSFVAATDNSATPTVTTDTGAVARLGPDITTQANWRVISLRMDPCAEQDTGVCNVEFRLIVQPFSKTTGRAIDTAAHLLYNMGSLKIAGKNSSIDAQKRTPGLPADITFAGIVKDLAQLKTLAKQAGADTNGVPLGVHPGLAKEAASVGAGQQGALAQELLKFIKKYTQGGLTTVTSMQLTSPPEPWVFFVGEVHNGTWAPVAITGGSAAMSIRFAALQAQAFIPVPDNISGIHNSSIMGNPSQQDFVNAMIIDNPGKFGGPEGRNSVLNTDCISCHVGATAINRLGNFDPQVAGKAINPQTGKPAMYVPADGITGYMGASNNPAKNATATGKWDFRNFGLNLDGQTASIESRMLNEAAEVVRFVNQDIMGVPNPGFKCKNSTSDAKRLDNHTKMWECNVRRNLAFATCAASICSGDGTIPGNPVGPRPLPGPAPRPTDNSTPGSGPVTLPGSALPATGNTGGATPGRPLGGSGVPVPSN